MLIVHQSKYHLRWIPFLNIRFRVLGFFTHSLTNPILENDIMTSSTIASLSAKAPHSLLSWAYQLPAVAFPNSNNILLLSASIQHSLVDWFWWKWKLKSADEGTNCRFWEGWSLGVSAGVTPSKSVFVAVSKVFKSTRGITHHHEHNCWNYNILTWPRIPLGNPLELKYLILPLLQSPFLPTVAK